VALLEIALLATASMFWPLLLVVVVVALETTNPARILLWFYIGGFITAASVGSALVFLLQDSPLMSGSRLPSAPGVDIAVGLLAVVAAYVLRRAHQRRERSRALRPPTKRRSRSKDSLQRLVEHGGPLAFAGGVVGSVVPGPFVILGMADIAQLGYSTIATLVVILCFFAIVFTFIEAPIAGFAIAPEWTKATTVEVKAWLDRNMLILASWALGTVGTFEVVRGAIAALI
jgi:Sap, sulfolipid-1-addressing protein